MGKSYRGSERISIRLSANFSLTKSETYPPSESGILSRASRDGCVFLILGKVELQEHHGEHLSTTRARVVQFLGSTTLSNQKGDFNFISVEGSEFLR